MRRRKLLLSLIFIFTSVLLQAQNIEQPLSHRIKLSAGAYSIGEILDKLNSDSKVNLTYNINEIAVDEIIEIKQKNPSLGTVLNEICRQVPLEYQIVNGYIILKKRKLDVNYMVSGRVVSSGDEEPLIGTNVYLSETLKGTVTNENGEFSFSSKPGDYTLVVSSIGYVKQETSIKLYDNLKLEFTLTPNSTLIQEVQITSQRQFFGDMNTGRTIESMNVNEIDNQNVNNTSDLLHARFAGVWSTKTSGLPGDHQRIRVRGLNSLFGSVDPLYVIDGVPVPIVNLNSLGIADMNIHDIESVTILKDASSTALYGFQGGNGVVLIETKQGDEKEVSFSSRFGVQWFSNFYDLMNTKDFLSSMDSSAKHLNKHQRTFYPAYSDTLKDTDWQDVIFRNGIVQEYQLAYSGGNVKNKFYISGNYLNHKGIIAGTAYKRYTLSSNYSRTLFSFLSAKLNYKGSYQNNQNNQDTYMGNRIILEGINKSPCLESTPDSYYTTPSGNRTIRIYYNYPDLMDKQSTRDYITKNNTLVENLSNSLAGSAQLNLGEYFNINLSSCLSYKRNYLTISKNPGKDAIYDYYLSGLEDYITINQQISLNYIKSFLNHHVGINFAFRNYKDNIWWKVDTIYTGGTEALNESFYPRNTMTRFSEHGSIIRSIRSYIGHINYNFKNKYFLSVAADFDQIREGLYTNKKSLFPSIAVNWDIAQEASIKNIPWINSFNLFANWGISGNFPLNGLTNDLYTEINSTLGNQTNRNPVVLQLANHNLKHEQIEEYNLGAKISLFNSKLSLNFVYYEKTNSNLIIQQDIPKYYGGGKQYVNINELLNQGFEAGFEVIPVETSNFKWYVAFNLSTYKQVVTKLIRDSTFYFTYDDLLVPDFKIEENEPLGNIIGYKILGEWDPATDSRTNISYRNRKQMKVLNADSSDLLINYKDKIIIGNSIPDFTCNLYNTFKFKNFELDLLWYAVIGVDKFNSTRAATYMSGTNREINNYINDSIRLIDDPIFYESSLFIEDASFIRLKSLTISYEPTKMFYNRIKTKFSLSFENLITFTKYKGYDPEATIYTDNNFTDNSIDRGAFPNPKGVYGTISLKF